MEYLTIAFLMSISLLIGMIIHKELNKYVIKKEIKDKKSEMESIFNEVLNSIKNGNSNFKSRFLKTSYVTTNTSKTGVIDIIYLMDKNDIAILKNNQIKYTSDSVDRQIIEEIISSIIYRHGKDINDVVNVFGLLFSKKDFEANFKMKFEDFNKIINKSMGRDIDSDIDNIIKNNQDSFDIDEILDKIGKYGMNSLTESERKYLNDYSNGQRD